MTEKTIGILGGMGPEATLQLYQQILIHTPATTDQEHLHVIIDSNPKIPNRTDAIMRPGSPDPTPALCETARNLERSGVDFIIMPCNTAHIFLPAILGSIHTPILSIVEATVQAILDLQPAVKCVGLLATPAVAATGLYAKPFLQRGITTLTPDAAGQEQVREVIFAIKAADKSPFQKAKLLTIGEQLIQRGARAIILACTELPLLAGPGDWPVPVVDTIDVLARAAVRAALNNPILAEKM